MDDILFGNNNQATINRLAKRSYRANKQRNVFVTIALFLTAFMITSVFSWGAVILKPIKCSKFVRWARLRMWQLQVSQKNNMKN